MITKLKALGSKRSTLHVNYDNLLSSFAFKFFARRYKLVAKRDRGVANNIAAQLREGHGT